MEYVMYRTENLDLQKYTAVL